MPFFIVRKKAPIISVVRIEMPITQKYQRGTFERSSDSAMSEIININNAIADSDSVKIVATWSFHIHKTM